MKFIKYLILAFYLVSPFNSIINAQSESKNPEIIASIENHYSVTFDDLKKYVKDWLYDKKYLNKTEAYQNALDALLINQMKRFDFFARGLDKDKSLIKNVQRVINEEMTLKYFDNYFLSKFTDEAHIADAYNKMGKEVVCRQIVLHINENASEKQIDSIRKKAEQIKSSIDKGKNFEKLVSQYSQDPSSKSSKGYIAPITWEQSLNDPVSNAIFSLKRGDVRILESDNSFIIANISAVNKLKVEPIELIKNEIIEKLQKGYYFAALEEYENFKKTLIDESTLVWNNKAVHKIVAWSQNPKFYTDLYADSITREISGNGNDTILTYSNKVVDLKQFLRLLDEILILNSSEKTSEQNIKEFILETLKLDEVVNRAYEKDLLKDIFNPITNNSVIKNRLVWMYNKAVIESQIPDTTSQALEKFYNEQKDSLYFLLDKVNIYALIFSNKDQADSADAKIKSGTPFEKISDRWFVKTYVIDREGNYKSFLSKENPYLADAAFNLKLDETTGPIEYEDDIKGKQYAIIKCVGKQNQKQLTYSEVKNKIASDFTKVYYENISKQNETDLKNKFNIKIYNELLTNLIVAEK